MTRTVAPSTVTNGRLSVVPGAVIVVATSHAAAPRGSRQKRSEVTVLSGPYHAMYAVPAASTATPGLCPAPMVNGVAARAAAGASKATAARTDAMATGEAPIATAVASQAKASVAVPAGAASSTIACTVA